MQLRLGALVQVRLLEAGFAPHLPVPQKLLLEAGEGLRRSKTQLIDAQLRQGCQYFLLQPPPAAAIAANRAVR
ncbi:hypothetical protein D3C81_1747440 [compost metagenome]